MIAYRNIIKYCALTISRYSSSPAFLFLLFILSQPAYSDDSVVLVTSKASAIEHVTLLDVRRIYLGITPKDSSHINKPVLNLSDKTTYNNFIKNVMHMTEDGYRRKIVKRVFRRGNDYIIEIPSLDELIEHLKNNKNDISYMKKSDIQDSYDIKIIAVLW